MNSNIRAKLSSIACNIAVTLIVQWMMTTDAEAGGTKTEIQVVSVQGQVTVSNLESAAWRQIRENQFLNLGDSVRTGANSRAVLRWSDQSVMYFDALTEAEVLPPNTSFSQSGLHLVKGIISFFHRDQPGRIQITTSGAVAGVDGTEFVLGVNESKRTTLSVIDGKVSFGNARATIILTNGQQAFIEPGKLPVHTSGFIANNILQWSFSYPAVLDLDDLTFTQQESDLLKESLNSYRNGDLLVALEKYPASYKAKSDSVHIYRAALLLSVGQIGEVETALSSISITNESEPIRHLATAIREVIVAVKKQQVPSISIPQSATELIAQSYYEQSRAILHDSLANALELARQAVRKSPGFGFAWERAAELEFSFGHGKDAIAALDRSLVLAPRNAQALALKGFLMAAQNKPHQAITWFESSLAVDSSLGNAWLGRGLCRIRLSDLTAGREDLLVAAALEPQRAELRAYLGKAYANSDDYRRALKELRLAIKLDPNDPTAWFYIALLDQQENKINDALQELEKSEALNNNRSIYRSQFLLDQDRAVRSANLAAIYKDAGLSDIGINEALKAVECDYGNYSAHLFLANSYSQLVDPNDIGLRYETAKESEYLLANLLSPAAAGTMSQAISQQEYTRLFERNKLSVASETEYLSRGALSETGAQYGIDGNSSYDIEGHYSFDPGQRQNDDFEKQSLNVMLKQQLSPHDGIYLQVFDYNATGGDLHQYYAPNMASHNYRFEETQEPTVIVGYHRQWNPGIHTLLLMARIDDTYSYNNTAQPVLVDFAKTTRFNIPEIVSIHGIAMNDSYENESVVYSTELQQIWEAPERNTIIGGRAQYGEIDTQNYQTLPSSAVFYFPLGASANQDLDTHFDRLTAYGYQQWQFIDSMRLYAGLTFDWMKYPADFQTVPVSESEQGTARLSPKAGVIWSPTESFNARFAYSRSLGGTTVDQSYQIEPSEIAGFVQSFRSIIPESVSAESPGAGFESYGVSLEKKIGRGTYIMADGQLLNSRVSQEVGAFEGIFPEETYAFPSVLAQNLDYHEKSLQGAVYQLLGEEWSLGGQYRVSRSDLRETFPDIGNSVFLFNFPGNQWSEATLQQAKLFAVYNNPLGFFASGEALWNNQSNVGYNPALPSETFWQINAFVGYRFHHREAELRLGLLNILNQDYNLNPLNPHQEFDHQRTLSLRLRLNF
ncbi:MAG TPA: TonB-dependent receptor [Verrucomicrobiae bacterium]